MNSSARPEWDLLLSFSQKNHADRIQVMLANGVDPNHANAVGQSALHIASLWGHVESARVLLEGGANPNAKNRLMGSTPLHMVAQSHKSSPENALLMVDLLIQNGADISLTDDHGNLPVSFVSDPTKKTLIDKLQPQKPSIFEAIATVNDVVADEAIASDPSCVNLRYMGLTPVSAAVERLIELSEDEDGNSTLVTSALSILKLLMENGGQLTDSSSSRSSSLELSDDTPPLHKVLEALRMAFKSDPESPTSQALKEAVLLLHRSLGAPLTQESRELLHQAARRNEVFMARFLIDQLEVDPNTHGRQGMTALQFAARSEQMDTLRYLLSLDTIDAGAKDDRGQTALDSARVNGKQEAVGALEGYLQKLSVGA